jgi:hemolysin III
MGVIGIVGIIVFINYIPLPGIISFFIGVGLLIGSGIVYILKIPNPKPDVFGFHEIFHILLLASTIAFHNFVSITLLSFGK